MKIARRILLVIVVCLLLAYARSEWRSYQVREPLQEALTALKRDGFKTELSELSSGIGGESLRKVYALSRISKRVSAFNYSQYVQLAHPLGSNTAYVALRDVTSDGHDRWQFLREHFNRYTNELDAACFTLLSAPLETGLNMDRILALAPHINEWASLSSVLAARTLIELRDGHPDSAWSNLLAVTRLGTQAVIGPDEISFAHKLRWLNTAYKVTWETLQTNVWSDEQLALLQTEWIDLELWNGLPDTAAHTRIGWLQSLEIERKTPIRDQIGGPWQAIKTAWDSGFQRGGQHLWRWSKELVEEMRYRRHTVYQDQLAVIQYHGEIETQLRRAIKCQTWQEIMQVPGITNTGSFVTPLNSRVAWGVHSRNLVRGHLTGYHNTAGSAATYEVLRRLVITALALERFHQEHGDYPTSLSALTPRFLAEVPVDFMDGQPLRYQRYSDQDFLLYSVGHDCMDNGGNTTNPAKNRSIYQSSLPNLPQNSGHDLVWPRAASVAEVAQDQQKLADYRTSFIKQTNTFNLTPEIMRRYGLTPPAPKTNKVITISTTNQITTTKEVAKPDDLAPQ